MHELDIGPEKSKRKTSEDKAVDAVHSALDKVAYCANFVMALLMVLMSIDYFYSALTGSNDLKVTASIGNIILLVCGAIIIADKKRSLPRSVGVYAVGMGLYRAFSVMGNLHPRSEIDYIDTNIIYLVIIAVGLNMAVSGRAYLKGASRARITMMYSAMAMFLICAISLIYLYATNDHDLTYLVQNYGRYIILALMYLTYILILDTEKLRRLDWLEVHNRSLGGITRTYHLAADAAIEEYEAHRLAEGMSSEKGWIPVSDGGPARIEMRAPIWNGTGLSYLTAQKWHGSDNIYLTMSDHEDGTLIQATRLVVDGIEMRERKLRLSVSDGTVIELDIVEELRCSGTKTAHGTRRPSSGRSWCCAGSMSSHA